MRQRIVSVFSSIFVSISRLLRPGTKRRTLSFFCSCLIIFDLKTNNIVSVFSRNQSEKPTKQSRYLQVSFLEGSAVIDEGDYQLFKQVLFHPRFSCVSYKYLRISKSQQQSSHITFLCQKFAVINEEGDYSWDCIIYPKMWIQWGCWISVIHIFGELRFVFLLCVALRTNQIVSRVLLWRSILIPIVVA